MSKLTAAVALVGRFANLSMKWVGLVLFGLLAALVGVQVVVYLLLYLAYFAGWSAVSSIVVDCYHAIRNYRS